MKVFASRLFTFTTVAALAAGGCAQPAAQPAEHRGLIAGLGDVARASIDRKKRVAGALISVVAGAGGALVGARHDKLSGDHVDEALQASARAERSPAQPQDVARDGSADLNGDGFITLDEVVALKQANVESLEIIDRLQRTQQVFELASWQEKYLRDRGVDSSVIDAMRNMNRKPIPVGPAAASADDIDRDVAQGG